MQYFHSCDPTEQFQHLSSLTALRQLTVQVIHGPAGHLPGIEHLSQLSSLQLYGSGVDFSTSNTQHWTRLTALQSLTLECCDVQPEAVSKFTQLQALDVDGVSCLGGASLQGLFDAVSQLSLLTSLVFPVERRISPGGAPPAAAAFTALTASTNLCSLQLANDTTEDWVLFRQGTVYPCLHKVDLAYYYNRGMPLSAQQLQQLCTSCPAVKYLTFDAFEDPSPTAWQPLMQLSALTSLSVNRVRAAVPAVTGVAAQLTGLRQLELWDLPQLTHPALLQLTALAALEGLTLASRDSHKYKRLQNKARFGSPPDVWMQLQQYLSCDMDCP